MSAAALIDRLAERGVRLLPRGDRLAVEAPRGVVTPADLDALRTCKAALLALLAPPAPPEPPPADLDPYLATWRRWLADLLWGGEVRRHLGPEADRKARALLDRKDAVDEVRRLVLSTERHVWPIRYAARGLPYPPEPR
jgi:hypothetical protein